MRTQESIEGKLGGPRAIVGVELVGGLGFVVDDTLHQTGQNNLLPVILRVVVVGDIFGGGRAGENGEEVENSSRPGGTGTSGTRRPSRRRQTWLVRRATRNKIPSAARPGSRRLFCNILRECVVRRSSSRAWCDRLATARWTSGSGSCQWHYWRIGVGWLVL